MRYFALACDYDGTIATHGVVDQATIEALERLRASGRRLLLVTGRQLDDLARVFPAFELFDRIVAENGALLYRPDTKEETPLCEPPPPAFATELARRGVPVSLGRVIVATVHPHEAVVLDVIRELGLEHQVIFNKGAVMVLPPSVNKASGLDVALKELELSRHEAVGVGDAENDHAFLAACECGVAVANALPMLKERADLVTEGHHGAGVIELVDRLLADDLRSLDDELPRHRVILGTTADDQPICLPTYGPNLLVAGPSGSGKSTFATGLIERLRESGYQIAIFDPEGDYTTFEHVVSIGDPQRPPTTIEIEQLLGDAQESVAVNLLGVPLADRPAFFAQILPRIQALRAKTGRPHWLVIDEAHHLLPTGWRAADTTLPQELVTTLMITLDPSKVSRAILSEVDVVVAVGASPLTTLADFARSVGRDAPRMDAADAPSGSAVVWRVDKGDEPVLVTFERSRSERRRHDRKYAEGDVREKSFFFRGRDKRLNLRAQNLAIFVQMAEGVDEDTWSYHLECGDVSRWFREAIKDEELAAEAERIESDRAMPPAESLELVKRAIDQRYTLAA